LADHNHLFVLEIHQKDSCSLPFLQCNIIAEAFRECVFILFICRHVIYFALVKIKTRKQHCFIYILMQIFFRFCLLTLHDLCVLS
jgi:hypothetical protein